MGREEYLDKKFNNILFVWIVKNKLPIPDYLMYDKMEN